jgi:hypothetical protein
MVRGFFLRASRDTGAAANRKNSFTRAVVLGM